MHLLNVDLHCHSNVSDGTLPPEAVAARAQRQAMYEAVERFEALTAERFAVEGAYRGTPRS